MNKTSESRFLRINSKYRDVTAVPNETSDFYYSFQNRFADRVTDIAVTTVHFPRLFGNMYAPISTLHYLVGNTPTTFTVPDGQYTATELAALLDASVDFMCTYNTGTHRFEFEYDSSPADVTFLPHLGMADYIGLTAEIILVPFVPIVMQAPPTLSGPSIVYVQSKFLAQTRCLDTPFLSNYIPLVFPVDISGVPYGFDCHFLCPQLELTNIHFDELATLRYVDVQLTDAFGNTLPFPRNAFCDLTFRMLYSRDSS